MRSLSSATKERPVLTKTAAQQETSASAEAALLRLTLGSVDAAAWDVDFALLQGKFRPSAGRA